MLYFFKNDHPSNRGIHTIFNPQKRTGAVLIIALAFVVLLTILVVAFLSRATLEDQVSVGSASQVQVQLLTQGALASILSDLKQEIAAGSIQTTITSTGSSSVASTYYTPTDYTSTTTATATPAYVGVNAGTGTLANLIKESSCNLSFFPSTGYIAAATYPPSNRAAPLSTGSVANGSSIGGTSLNGRYLTPARWNEPLLIPATSTTDLTPVTTSGFSIPDWILVARDGSNPTAWNSNMITSRGNLNTTSTVVGRYAYIVYDEGGLLDMNVAGYPGKLPQTLSGYKNALALADLTQLKDSFGNSLLTQSQIDAIVGWRNNASAYGASASPPGMINGSSGIYTWSAVNATNYYNYLTNTTTGFLQINPTLANINATQTDQAFVSRQQLIQFVLKGLGGGISLQNALQYMGTFSRDINQPSTVTLPELTAGSTPASITTTTRATLAAGDATHRPTVVPPSNSGSPACAYYQGGNDAYGGNDPSMITGTNDTRINPSFLSVRVNTPFVRFDGSIAQTGEPLLKKRFPLSRIALLSTSTAPYQTTATNSNSNSVFENFGLFRSSTSAPWFYNHNITNSSGQTIIGTLAMVRDANREPDFFELLKAAITSGSIGKGADAMTANPNGTTATLQGAGLYQQNLDVATDFQILQIGANIIEQYKSDAYPIRIDIQPTAAGTKWEFRGSENLPYFNAMRFATFQTTLPNPLPTLNTACPYYVISDANTLSSGGLGFFMMQPVLWNPLDPNSSVGIASPTKFRIVIDATDPTNLYDFNGGTLSTYQSNALKVYDEDNKNEDNANISKTSSGFNSVSTTPLTFTLSQNLFREPTLLSIPNVPSGSNLAGTTITDQTPGHSTSVYGSSTFQFLGFSLGTFPLRFASTSATIVFHPNGPNAYDSYYTGNRSFSTNAVQMMGPTYFTVRVQYADPVLSTQWDTYDEKCFSMDLNVDPPSIFVDDWMWSSEVCYMLVGSGTGSAKTFQAQQLAGTVGQLMGYDPRSSRFCNTATCILDTSGQLFGPPPYGINSNYRNYPSSVVTYNSAPYNSFINQANNVIPSDRAGSAADPGQQATHNGPGSMWTPGGTLIQPIVSGGPTPSTIGWSPVTRPATYDGGAMQFYPGQLEQNDPKQNFTYYSDADGIVRPAMGYNATGSTSLGLPMATATSGGSPTSPQNYSRPIILHRPFSSVADLGYVFSGTPWKNLDFWTAESGNAALLDVFCLNETQNPTGMVAGKVNLNSRQVPVLTSVLNGSYKDETAMQGKNGASSAPGALLSTEASTIAQALVTRTTNKTTLGKGPIKNLSELVGRYVYGFKDTFNNQPYDGFSADLSPPLYTAGTSDGNVQRFREASIRALSNAGTARVWNLMIDIVAQSGHYPVTATGLNNFNVEAEQRYWLHAAIDRYTGKVIDSQLEVVKE